MKQAGLSCCEVLFTGLSNGTTYWFEVTASNQSGEGSPSGQVSATPQGPAASGWAARRAMPTPRANHAVGVVNGILYAVGGCCINLNRRSI